MSTNSKDLRKQLRNVIQALLPELLTNEILSAIREQNHKEIKKIEEDVKKTMHEMNERQKDTLGYLVRQSTVSKG